MDLFKTLTEAPGAPGFEGPVREIMEEHLTQYSEKLIYDNLGSVFGVKTGDASGPRIMVAGHMDEVAFMVKRINEQGFIQFQTLGGWWSQVLLAQRVEVMTDNGPLPGVIGSIPPHVLDEQARRKPMQINKMFIDIGADSKEHAEQLGVKPGQPIIPVCPFTVMADDQKLLAKAWDNRYGCALSIELLREIQNVPHPNLIFSGATVQEEVGLRGAATSANLLDPDLFIGLDASAAGDIPGLTEGMGKLGGGLLMRIYDRTMITHPGLRDYVIDLCEAEGIKYQFFVSMGGTDAGRVHTSGQGVPSIVIGIPARYIHSHTSIIHKDDYEAAKKLLLSLVKKMDQTTLQQIKQR
ncbi:peptidase M28 [Ammoniphilus oxalaticus]|uniref:Peptidase M28 n=1 Tax=Ammoniphilus oxalaticus TaxID=66863 RepID=A0A419SP54_9BACL|nr:M42 family metallopeptidase [Ammoniphilus oxalaticus]RKD26022.1 peptidase M28 [Ammoniphilus oxalaticus]